VLDPDFNIVECAAVKTNGKKFGTDIVRISKIADTVIRLIENSTVMADEVHVCFEGYAFSRRQGTGKLMERAELTGVIKNTLYSRGYGVYDVPQKTHKKFGSGMTKAKIDKDDIASGIFSQWGLRFRTDDEADAYVCALFIGKVLRDRVKLDYRCYVPAIAKI